MQLKRLGYRLNINLLIMILVLLLDIGKANSAHSFVQEKQTHSIFAEWEEQKKYLAAQKQSQSADGAILFVSFSLPERLLVELSEQAHIYGIPVVVRGLVNNDFKQTLIKINALYRYANTNHKHFYGLSIDPLWFEQFNIQVVPALIITRRPQECLLQSFCPNQPYVLLYGTTSMEHALEVIRDKNSAFKGIAEQLLKKGRHYG